MSLRVFVGALVRAVRDYVANEDHGGLRPPPAVACSAGAADDNAEQLEGTAKAGIADDHAASDLTKHDVHKAALGYHDTHDC